MRRRKAADSPGERLICWCSCSYSEKLLNINSVGRSTMINQVALWVMLTWAMGWAGIIRGEVARMLEGEPSGISHKLNSTSGLLDQTALQRYVEQFNKDD